MLTPDTRLQLATQYHKDLPQQAREYLNGRGITDDVLDAHLLGWNGHRITIPVFDREGKLAFFKLAKDPNDATPGPKIMASAGAHVELYGWEVVLRKPSYVVICEGEFDRLVLEGNGFEAVTSTGGAGSFRDEWAKDFKDIPRVFVCFDRDDAGRRGALRVAWAIPHAKIVELPSEVGEGGDATDFFVRLGRRREAFLRLLEAACPAPDKPAAKPPAQPGKTPMVNPQMSDRVARVKREAQIEKVVGEYVQLRPVGKTFVGRCPFHEDRNPSLTVYPETGTFRCYGCGKRGDVISFVEEAERMTFKEALDALDRYAA